MKKFLIICFAFFVSFLRCQAAELSAGKLYEQKVNSVFLVETQNSRGSGIILSEDGTFVTCFHVIEDANYIRVKTKKGDEYKVVGFKYLNPDEDIAILTIKTTKKFVPFVPADSASVNVGDMVYTISNPVNLQFVFSSGMINQLDKKSIQYSAPSSPGSSGGALFDTNGNLLGMIASQYSPSKAQNINFAIQNSLYFSHLTDSAKNNTKNQPWSDFVASKISKKDLEAFVNHAYQYNKFSMLYKYMPYLYPDDEIASDNYAFQGLYGLSVYMDGNFDNRNILNDSAKWFARSILSNKSVEESAVGLFVVSLFTGNYSGMAAAYESLKKYPKSRQVIIGVLERLLVLEKSEERDETIANQYLQG